jgi:lipooligosaccharide transport system permease protein
LTERIPEHHPDPETPDSPADVGHATSGTVEGPQTIGGDAALFETRLHAHAPEVSARKVRRHGAWYVTEYYLRAIIRYGDVVLADAVGSPLMYVLAMGVGLGSLLVGNGTLFDDVSYITFIAPALLVSGAVQGAVTEATFPVMDGFKWHRLYQGPVVTPITPQQIARGQMLAIAIRLFVQSLIFLGVVALFGAVHSWWALLAVFVATLSGLALGLPIMAYSATIREEKGQFSVIMRFIFMPLFMFSGTFYPLTNLPFFLQWIGWISPIWHGTEVSRLLMYGHAVEPWLVVLHLLVLAAFAVVGYLFTVRNFTSRLKGEK